MAPRHAGRSSRSPRRPSLASGGFALVWVLLVLVGIAAAATALAPSLIRREAEDAAVGEDRRIQGFADGFRRYAQRNAVLPGPNSWAQSVADTVGSNLTSVRQVFPQFANETTSRRVLVIDPRFQPALTGAILPFTQPSNGIDPAATPGLVPNIYARAMILSSSKRGLAIPLPNGVAGAAMFDQLWDWAYDPSTGACPLSSMNANWNRQGRNLHIGRVDLTGLFHLISFRKLTFAANRGTPVMVAGTAQRYFMEGTVLDLYALTNGMKVMRHVVGEAASFDLGSPYEPLVWWGFETGIPAGVAFNAGRLGTVANGELTNGCASAASTLHQPTYPGYATNNASLSLDGVDDYVESHQALMNGLTQFSLTCWINPSAVPASAHAAFLGQQGVAAAGFSTTGSSLEFATAAGGTITAAYSHPASEWHHVAFTADGARLRIYVDGILVATGGSAPAGGTYGTSAAGFRAGGGGIFTATGNFFQGQIDEACLFNRALSASQITSIMANAMP